MSEKEKRKLYSEHSVRMVDLYNKMMDVADKEVIPELVKQNMGKGIKHDGWVDMLDGKEHICWCLYRNWSVDGYSDNSTCWLFLPDGRIVVSRQKKDNTWIYDDRMSFCHNDDTGHHDIFHTVRIFDGLIKLAQEKVLEVTLSFWKDKFDFLYAQYCRAKDDRFHQTGMN